MRNVARRTMTRPRGSPMRQRGAKTGAAMTPQEMERALRQTLADGRLSAGERSALTQALADAHLDAQKAAAVRATAFALAREAVGEPRAREALGWLEDVVK